MRPRRLGQESGAPGLAPRVQCQCHLRRNYCDHQENRKSVIGRDHLRVPSGVPLPAVGLSAASGLSLESTQRGTTASRWAECSEWTVYQPMG